MRPRAFALAAALAIGVAGCAQAAHESAGSVVDDSLAYAQIESQLATIDASSALHVAVSVHGGDVTLSGKTRDADIAARFVKAARDVPGVKHVDAQLRPDRRLPSASQAARDFALAAAVGGSIATQAGVNALAVRPSAANGVVTLRGTLKTDALKSTVVEAAKGTPGVKTVVDDLHVGS